MSRPHNNTRNAVISLADALQINDLGKILMLLCASIEKDQIVYRLFIKTRLMRFVTNGAWSIVRVLVYQLLMIIQFYRDTETCTFYVTLLYTDQPLVLYRKLKKVTRSDIKYTFNDFRCYVQNPIQNAFLSLKRLVHKISKKKPMRLSSSLNATALDSQLHSIAFRMKHILAKINLVLFISSISLKFRDIQEFMKYCLQVPVKLRMLPLPNCPPSSNDTNPCFKNVFG